MAPTATGAALPSRAYLCFDVGGQQAAYARAVAFVENTDLRYGLSSKRLAELGGSERARLPELYESDFEYGGGGPIVTEPPPAHRVVLELHADAAPLAVQNFAALCSGDKGVSKESGVALCYRGSKVHRVVKGFMMQGGDINLGNGAGGESVFGKKFKDDAKGLKGKFAERGVLAMGNSGKNSNTSQFFITFAPAKALEGKHVVFGRVVEGLETLDAIEAVARGVPGDETPSVEVVVYDCGVLP